MAIHVGLVTNKISTKLSTLTRIKKTISIAIIINNKKRLLSIKSKKNLIKSSKRLINKIFLIEIIKF